MKKNSQDISEQDFQQHNKATCQNYERPSPTHPTRPNEFDKLVYVATTTFSQKPQNNFNHGDASPFRSVTSPKNKL